MSKQSLLTPKLTTSRATIALSVCGVALLVLYRMGVRSETVADIVWFLKLVAVQAVIFLACAWLSLSSKDSRSVLILVLVFAALFRLSIVFSPPYLSDDIYRFIWDGRVQAAGINPYRYIPADQSLSGLRDEEIYPKINRKAFAHTMYPPVAEGVFLLATRLSESVTWMKTTMIAFEGVAIWAIIQLLASFGFARQRVLIYAWHPLAVWEFAGSGHLDAIAVAFVALALLAFRRNAHKSTGVMLACAALVKFFPAVLLPAFLRGFNWKMPLAFVVTIILAYSPYMSVGPAKVFGYLPGYAEERGMLSGDQFFILGVVRRFVYAGIPMLAYLIVALLVLAIVSVWLMRSQQENGLAYLRHGLVIASVFMVLLTPHFSWYFCWLIVFLCFIPSSAIFYQTLASFLLYLTWLGDPPDKVLALKALIFVPSFVLSVLVIWLRRRKVTLGFVS
jgi:alpha-1,6-mannosyltransferase